MNTDVIDLCFNILILDINHVQLIQLFKIYLKYYRIMHYSCDCMSSVCLSVCLSVTLVDHSLQPKGHPPTLGEHGEILGRLEVVWEKSETREDRKKVTMEGLQELTNALLNGTVPTLYGLLFPKIGGSQPPPKTSITIISGTHKATDFKFGRYIHRVHPNKSPLKILEKKLGSPQISLCSFSPKFLMGFFPIDPMTCIQNLKFVALPVPEIIDCSFRLGLRTPNLGMVPFERALVSSYRRCIVTFTLCLRVSEILPLLCSSTPLFPTPPLVSPNFPMFPWDQVSRLTESDFWVWLLG